MMRRPAVNPLRRCRATLSLSRARVCGALGIVTGLRSQDRVLLIARVPESTIRGAFVAGRTARAG
jgi:hypothetical protein